MNQLETVSPSRTYIQMIANVDTGYEFIRFELSDHLKNTSSIASNTFLKQYLNETAIADQGLFVGTFAIEQFKISNMADSAPEIVTAQTGDKHLTDAEIQQRIELLEERTRNHKEIAVVQSNSLFSNRPTFKERRFVEAMRERNRQITAIVDPLTDRMIAQEDAEKAQKHSETAL